MDYQFPPRLFPSFYTCGPPDSVLKHSAGSWGGYDRVGAQGGPGPLSSWTFTSRHQLRGETWRHTEPVPVPLLSPKKAFLWPVTPPDPLDFAEHMQNFYVDHGRDAFRCMSGILGENFNQGKNERYRRDSANMWKVKSFLDLLKFNICQQSYSSTTLNRYSGLLSDVVHDIPPDLLGSLLHEELAEQRDRLLFGEGATGGALAFAPFSQSSSLHGCLLYPGNPGLTCLNFHKVALQHRRGGASCVDASSSKPHRVQLKAPVRQISCASLFNDCCVAVRSDHLCGIWRFSERSEPRVLQVVNTREVATCISVSPHILGEVLVASESGAVNLWTVSKGMQMVRTEDSNLYFNAKSSWRWCEFCAHPRMMLYADRTGAEMSDIRVNEASGHTLFRISSSSECQSGERLLLSRYLGDVHPFHHLITTQFSAYIMDERFPCVPMLKWDHMMQSPPLFCHVLPGCASSVSAAGDARTAKVLLGSHNSQEITLLQYSGGRAEACFSRGPPQALLRPRDSLRHLPVQIPHRLDTATDRLSSPAAGLTCIQEKAGRGPGGEESMCILQLTEAGDIFYQILEPEQPDTSQPPAAEDELLPQQVPSAPPQPPLTEATTSGEKTAEQLPADFQQVISDTSSDEGVVWPTQGPATQRTVAETPERERRTRSMSSGSSADESDRKSRYLRLLQLQVVVNNDPELLPMSGSDADEKDGNAVDEADDAEGRRGEEVAVEGTSSSSHVGPSPRQPQVKLSSSALVTWKRWLQKLMQKSNEKKPRPRRLQHFTIKNERLLRLSDNDAGGSSEEERVHSLRRDLRSCMSRRSLLVHSAVSAAVTAPDVVPVPNQVDTEVWMDPLSRRLTLSWQGEEAWRAWWEDQLGTNKEGRMQALRRRRRKEKEAKRAASHRLELSGSFTSSSSYQRDLDSFSSSGWSSAASQGGWSESEGRGVTSDDTRAATPSTVQTDAPTPTATPQSLKGKRADHQTPTFTPTQTQSPKSTPASWRRNKRPAEDDLSSLFAPQDDPSQDDFPLQMTPTHRPHAASLSSPSQFVLRRSVRVDLSRDAIPSSFLSLSQSSQGRLSQASQPKKKKSRMGF